VVAALVGGRNADITVVDGSCEWRTVNRGRDIDKHSTAVSVSMLVSWKCGRLQPKITDRGACWLTALDRESVSCIVNFLANQCN